MRAIKEALILLLAIATPLTAACNGAGCRNYDPYSCFYWPTHVDFDGYFGANWDNADVTLFWPAFQADYMMGFAQGSIGRFHDQWHGNVGIGYRVQLSGDFGWGANIFCDYSYSDRTKLNWLQGGIGVELLGRNWEIRANGYIPDFDRRRASFNQDSTVVLDPDSPDVVITTVTTIVDEQARWGFDAEVGVGVCLGPGSLWGYAGYLYNKGRDLEARQGPRLRGEYKLPLPFCWGESELWVGGEYRYDERHRSQGSVYVHVQVPLYGWRSGMRCPNLCLFKRMSNSVRRRNGLLLERLTDRSTVVQNIQLFFIREGENNANPGTQTNPTSLFTANADSLPGDFIFALNRNPNPPGMPIPINTELGTPYSLKPDQTLIGFGDASSVTLDFGNGATLVVQDLDGAGRGAFSQVAGMNAIVVNNDNLVQGIEIQGGLNSISGTTLTDVTIDDVIMNGFASAGVRLTDVSGTTDITAAQIDGVNGATTSGIVLANSGGVTSTIDLAMNRVTRVTADGILITQAGIGGTISAILENNQVTSIGADAGGAGIHLTTDASSSNATFDFRMTDNLVQAVAPVKPGVFMSWNSAAGQSNTISGALTGTNTIAAAGGGGFPGLLIGTGFSNPTDMATLLSDGTRFDTITGQALDSLHGLLGTVNLTIQDNIDSDTAGATTRVFFISSAGGTNCLTMTGNDTNRGGGVPGDNIELFRGGGTFNVTNLSALSTNNNNITTQVLGNPTSVTTDCPLPLVP